VLCGFIPFAPVTPTTRVVGDKVVIEWVPPSANGSPLLGYTIKVQQADMTFAEEIVYCDGGSYNVFTNTACTIPLAVLTSSTFLLTKGMQVNAKVAAYNVYGSSAFSNVGNGAIVVLVPDAPFDLKDDTAVTNAF
jgi:hypothetical protein